MYKALGHGKGDTLLASVAILGCPMYSWQLLLAIETSNFDLQTMAVLVLRGADTECQPFCSEGQQLEPSTEYLFGNSAR